jgi:hypothetical protein
MNDKPPASAFKDAADRGANLPIAPDILESFKKRVRIDNERPPNDKPPTSAFKDAAEQRANLPIGPDILGWFKKRVGIDNERPPNLFNPRRIASTSEIGSLFWNKERLSLLVSDPSVLPRLSAGGAETGTKLAYIRRGAEIDFAALNDYLPFVAQQTIVPMLGDLIPQTSWGSSLANLLTKGCWDKLRQRTFALTGFRCEICGSNRKLECHELWEYHEPLSDAAKHACGAQRLIRLIGLCSACHETHHLGLAEMRGRLDFARERITAYNRWSEAEFDQYFEFLIDRYDRRSDYSWVLDVSCVADTLLVVQGKWKLQESGFLCGTTHTGDSETMLLGARWQQAGVIHEANA